MSQYYAYLSWAQNQLNSNLKINSYKIYTVDDGEYNLLTTLGSNTFQYRHINVEKDKKYTYAIVAVTSGGFEGKEAKISIE